MTRKDFLVIARSIATLPVDEQEKTKIAEHFADHLSKENNRFNRNRFVSACLE